MSDKQTRIVPYLCTHDTVSAIDFYIKAFGAVEIMRMMDGDRVSHAEIQIDGARIMLSDEHPEINVLSPKTVGGSPVMLILEVPDLEGIFNQAVGAGASIDRPIQDAGDFRNGKLVDPYGHRWMILSYVNEVSS